MARTDELAVQREWREAFAVEGRLADTTPGNLARFLEWAEDSTPAVPPVPTFRPMMRSTVVTWRSRHCRMASSRSSRSSPSS